ncbi:MAG: MBOAT family protein [Pseudomonadales bacterium]|nr:MBOAT family protein [Pseudomonadales bacterium]
MLFNSFEFIALFLPITVLGYYTICRFKPVEWGLTFLLLASLFFYGFWNPVYLILLGFSIVVNFGLGRHIGNENNRLRKPWLVAGIALNLSLLAYFKYFNFFVNNVNAVFEAGWNVENIILPLAISFFTFQQISYLVDAYEGEAKEYNFLHYALFVSFFPQLIAGPIVHHKEMLPQFFRKENLSPQLINFAVGISIFGLGLFKKTVLADGLSEYVSPVFDSDAEVDLIQAWGSALAYSFQLYFDFSGYSDMAIGCARLFGIKLPVNFFSPYKSLSIIEFWRRWHITLSRFLRDYLYIALGGNRKGKIQRYRNLFLTMLLGGLWHGAGWTFIVWGAMHGGFLVVNHGWRWLLNRINWHPTSWAYVLFAWSITFISVVFSFVYFRSPSLARANDISLAMLGFNGAQIPSGVAYRLGELKQILISIGFEVGYGSGSLLMTNTIWVIVAGAIALLLPNSAQLFQRFEAALFEKEGAFPMKNNTIQLIWKPSLLWSLCTALFICGGVLTLGQVSEFLYFQF